MSPVPIATGAQHRPIAVWDHGEVTDPDPHKHQSTRPAAKRTIRLRYTRTSLLAIVIAAICALPAVGTFWPWSVVVYVALVLAAYCVLRVGANINADVVTIRGPFYSRRVPRRDVAGLAVSQGGGVFLLRRSGSRILIPTAKPRDLPRLRELLFSETPHSETAPDFS